MSLGFVSAVLVLLKTMEGVGRRYSVKLGVPELLRELDGVASDGLLVLFFAAGVADFVRVRFAWEAGVFTARAGETMIVFSSSASPSRFKDLVADDFRLVDFA